MLFVADFAGFDAKGKRNVLVAGFLMLLASAMVVESDAYRYVTIALAIFAIMRHRPEVKQASKDWLALICYAWSAYVAVRFAAGIALHDEKGTSEWLYAFPALFPLVGVALHATRRHLFAAATLLMACGLVGLLATLDFHSIFQGERAAPLFHNNSIHAGVGSSMLFISSLFWVLYVQETKPFSRQWQRTCLIIGSSTASLSLIGVLGAQSKGAWVALAATACFLFILALLHRSKKSKFSLLAILAVSVVISTTIAMPSVEKVAGPTMTAASKLFQASMQSQPPVAVLEAGIKDPATPQAMRERLMLWTNALELINASPIIGWGNLWLREWRQTRYSEVGYTLLHNGYLEILVRHGIFGIAFLLVFASVAAARINAARVNGTIATSLAAYLYSLTVFFFCTIATNSNNRLALGESFFVLVGSSIFALTLLTKNPGGGRARLSQKASEEKTHNRCWILHPGAATSVRICLRLQPARMLVEELKADMRNDSTEKKRRRRTCI